MRRRISCLPALVLLCGVGQAGEPVTDDTRFIGQLRQGTVELLGITNYQPPTYRPTTTFQWWRADGLAAQLGPYRHQSGTRASLQTRPGTKGLSFLVRFNNRPAEYLSTEQLSYGQRAMDRYRPDVSEVADYPPAEQPAYGQEAKDHCTAPPPRLAFGFKPFGPSSEVDYIARRITGISSHRRNLFTPQFWSGTVVYADEDMVPNYYMFSPVVAAAARTANFRVGTSMGAWETVLSQKPDLTGSSTFRRDGKEWTVTFYRAEAAVHDRTRVTVMTTITWWEAYGRLTQRLVAVTSEGNEHTSKSAVGNWGDGRTLVYDLPLSSIKEFRFQVSPYDWVEFKNVSLQPGRKTDVRVVRLRTR